MRCEKCGKETQKLIISKFNRDGSDSEQFVFVETVDCPEGEDGCDVAILETDQNWTGYSLSEEEMMDVIRCPHCRRFPFKHKEVQVYDVVRIVCFRGKENAAD